MLVSFFLFLLGAGVGSFVYAYVRRDLVGESVLCGASHCDHCGRKLHWFELIPIFGWLICRGECRSCGGKIGIGTLLCEVVMATIFVASWLVFNEANIARFVLWLIIAIYLMILAIFDIFSLKLPNKIFIQLLVFSFIFWLISTVQNGQIFIVETYLELFLASLPIAGFYGIFYLISRGKLVGLGDVKLGIAITFLLPWQGGVGALILANFLTLFFVGAKYIIAKVQHNKFDIKQKVPLGAMLCFATILLGLGCEIFRGLL